jgi:murein DD-endopeptidase MepM/ murein hydrolase activator NlpD
MSLFPSSPSNLEGNSLRSIVWGNQPVGVSQDFGVYHESTAGMYGYAKDQGWPTGYHIGLDVAVPFGTKIYAAQDGEVTQSGPSPYFRPNPIWVKEKDDQTAIYGHLSKNFVTTGQKVKKGQLIGLSGEQDPQTGPHIHFELRNADGTAVNPVSELSGTGSLTGNGSFGKSFVGIDEESAKNWTLRIFFFLGGTVIIVVGLLAFLKG